jgi:hypothetical protein
MRNRRSLPAPAPSRRANEELLLRDEPPVRLRHFVLPIVFGCLAMCIYPRAKAAWTLHDAATALADYARCMAGPTGPGAVRDASPTFRELIRRRLLAAQPGDRPFAGCNPLAQELVPGHATEQVHGALASQFVEYSETPAALPDDRESFSVAAVGFDANILEALSDAAWPFERGGYRHLIEPSSTAREAAHPLPLPRPAVGAGFPAKVSLYRPTWNAGGRWFTAFGSHAGLALLESPDFGVTWKPASLNQPGFGNYAGRCAPLGAATSFTVQQDESGWMVQAWSGEQLVSTTRLASGLAPVRTSCDQKTLLLVVTAKQRRVPGVLACEPGRGCAPLNLEAPWLAADFDVAQVDGVSVVLTSGRGIARVRSSRDRGATWTPSVVVYDAAEPASSAVTAPNQLLVMGRRLMVYGQASAAKTYPVLYSDDYGASFHGVEVASTTAARRGPVAMHAR